MFLEAIQKYVTLEGKGGISQAFLLLSVSSIILFWFLADRTNGRAIGTMLRPSVFHRRLSVRNVLWLNSILV